MDACVHVHVAKGGKWNCCTSLQLFKTRRAVLVTVGVKIQIDLERGALPGPMPINCSGTAEGSLLPWGWPVGLRGGLALLTHLPGLSSPLPWASPSSPLDNTGPQGGVPTSWVPVACLGQPDRSGSQNVDTNTWKTRISILYPQYPQWDISRVTE